ncbi:hypothetical protein L6164_025533 [Bauhinia variegata]|uniref:Uncharacterized protein n=1 Tax=Bauhinia variegata TaxID=167791 RepID=A0ACB9M0T0_BAUVA|nr:hypothetical protein L6164_025533 [Bauhinia variegata]
MLAKESGASTFDLPEEVLRVLPSDPFEQLDVARKIISIALATRVNAIEAESSTLRAKLAEKDSLIAELQSQVESLDAALLETADKLVSAVQQKESLLKENASLSSTAKKLNRDVAKLEVFRRTLMQSLQEDEENSGGAPEIFAKIPSQASITSASQTGEDDATSSLSSTSSAPTQISDVGNSFAEDREYDVTRPRVSDALLSASQSSTPRITPPGSPPSLSASVSPSRTPQPLSPRRHSISFPTSRGMNDDRSSMFSAAPSGHGSILSSDTASQTGRTRVDGKEFFRQVRSRLSYEQFGAFLATVKELNSHKQTKEETLQKAGEIFGPENNDLYAIFEGLLTLIVH